MTTEKKTRIIPTEQWEAERPYYVMIHSKYWSEIKLNWKKSCRALGPQCETALESVDTAIQELEKILKNFKSFGAK